MKTFGITILVSITLAACGGGGGGSGSSSGGDTDGNAPRDVNYPQAEDLYLLGVEIGTLAPTFVGEVDQWSVSPALPTGMQLDEATGEIHGMPTEATDEITYTVTASNEDGSGTGDLTLRTRRPGLWAFAPNINDDTVSVFGVNAETGKLYFNGYYVDPVSRKGPQEAIVHPTIPVVYTPNLRNASQPGNISIYEINPSNGTLVPRTPETGTEIGNGPHSMGLSNDGRTAYVTSNGTDEVDVFSIDQDSGDLTLMNTLPTGDGPFCQAMDPLGRFFFVANHRDETISIYKVDAPSGMLITPPEHFQLETKPTRIRVSPSGSLLFIAMEDVQMISSWLIDPETGTLTGVDAQPTGEIPGRISVHPHAAVVYVPALHGDTLSAHAYDPVSGKISKSTELLALGGEPNGITIDEGARHAYVPCSATDEIFVLDIENPLSPVIINRLRGRRSPRILGMSHGDVPLDPRSEGLYVLNSGDDSIGVHGLDQDSGALTDVETEQLPESGATSFVVDPIGRHLSVVLPESRTIQVYGIDPLSCALNPIGVPNVIGFGSVPGLVTTGPVGTYLYINYPEHNKLESYRLDDTDGSLTFVDFQILNGSPQNTAVDPTGRFMYVGTVNGDGRQIRTLQLGLGTFIDETSVLDIPADSGEVTLQFSPSAEHLYATLSDRDEIRSYSISVIDGALLENLPHAVAAGTPRKFVCHPNLPLGVASLENRAGSGGLARFTVNATSGALAFESDLPAGQAPVDLSFDRNGTFLYVAHQIDGTIATKPVLEDGSLGETVTTPVGSSPVQFVIRSTF